MGIKEFSEFMSEWLAKRDPYARNVYYFGSIRGFTIYEAEAWINKNPGKVGLTGNMLYLLDYIPKTPVEQVLNGDSLRNDGRRINCHITPKSNLNANCFEIPDRASPSFTRPLDRSKLGQDDQDRATRKIPLRRGRRASRKFHSE